MGEARIHALTVPKWGMAMDEGTVTAWHIEEGGAVNPGDEVLDVESTKIANAIEAKEAGVLRRQVASVGQTLPVGGLLGVIASDGVGDDEIAAFIEGFVIETPEGDQTAGAPPSQTVEVGGQPIRYLAQGEEGPTVLMIHGFGGDLNAWMFNQPALAEGRRVIAVDLPGHGGSTKQVGDGGIAYLARIVAGLIDALGLEHVHLVGHSLGGAVALEVALDHPGKVASLTLIATAGLGPEINGGYISGFVAAQRRKDMKPLVAQLFADEGLGTRQMVEDILRAKRVDGVDAALAAIAAAQFDGDRQKLDLGARAGDLDVPVHIIWGAADRIIPAGHARNLKGAKVTVIDGAGHMPMMEKAGEVNHLIGDFIG